MKRAKRRQFRQLPWFKFVPTRSTLYQELKGPCMPNGVFPLMTGELGVIDCGIRFIVSRKV